MILTSGPGKRRKGGKWLKGAEGIIPPCRFFQDLDLLVCEFLQLDNLSYHYSENWILVASWHSLLTYLHVRITKQLWFFWITTTLHCTALHCTALHCTALHCIAMHCTALHYTVHVIEMVICATEKLEVGRWNSVFDGWYTWKYTCHLQGTIKSGLWAESYNISRAGCNW